MSLFGIDIGVNKSTASKESLASDWINSSMRNPATFKGSKADAQAILSQSYDNCASYVKDRGVWINGAKARGECQSQIDKRWAGVMSALEADSYTEEQTVKGIALKGNTQLYLIVAIVIIVAIIFLN